MLITVQTNITQIPANVRTRRYIGDRFQTHYNLAREIIVGNLSNRAFLRVVQNHRLLLTEGYDRYHVSVVLPQHDSECILVFERVRIPDIQPPSHDLPP